ncbi:uncharacterized protein IUM83_02365 [Phytophthora cinnamomi]|uniref:uncharacterized protein n=1 Tax=Phytophthora cinnamomi TaxID=4785 RepID=UPI003559C4AE|nr:hypothetical protein IUM83_02365 [Phytophthora cinnamomi]
MSSKLEYLQRYMSGGGGDAADSEKKKKKKVKKTKKSRSSSALGTRVVDADESWEHSAPSREAIEKKWELDAAEDEQPLVVAADGEELVDPQDLPVYVDSDSPKHRSSRRDSVERKEKPANRDRPRDSRVASTEVKSESRKKEVQYGDADKVKTELKPKGDEEKKAGLFTAAEFEHQRKIAAKRKDVLRGVDASEMGANAETVYRDKRGRKLDMLNEMVRQQEILDGKRKREEREEYEWGTGEVQKRERKSQQELLEQMKKTPFARHEDDEELERKRRERVRAFDPINSKIFQEDPLAEGKSKKKKSKKDKKKASKAKPKYAGPPAPPNRFGILPGYRWDGVVRGTNWEEKIMMRQNANAAVSEEAYKYAVADM